MDLKAAIKLAVRFAEKGKEPTIRQYVRFLPRTESCSARLCAQNLRCGVVVCLDADVDVPNTLIHSELLGNVVKEAKFTIEATPTGLGGVELKSGPATWLVPPENVPQLEWFPEVPLVPVNFQAIDGDAIERVVHAASKDEDRPNLQTLCFRQGCVEATDKARFARASLRGQWNGLLPVEMFQRPPKGDLQALFTLRLAYLKCEDEVRFAPYVPLAFPDCHALVPDEHKGFETVVGVEALTRAVKQAFNVSDTGSVTLKFEPNRVVVSSWKQEAEPKLFEAVVSGKGGEESQVLVNGKNLVAALKILRTPCVRLQYHRSMDPLRLESAGYVELLWPMLA